MKRYTIHQTTTTTIDVEEIESDSTSEHSNVYPIHHTRQSGRHISHVWFEDVLEAFTGNKWTDAKLMAARLGCSTTALYMHSRRHPNILAYKNGRIRKLP